MRLHDKSLFRFRCHTGHAFTARSLLAGLTERAEDALWNAVRAVEESAMLLAHIAEHIPPQLDGGMAKDSAAPQRRNCGARSRCGSSSRRTGSRLASL